MSDPDMLDKIIDAVSIPVMAKVRIGHFVEAQVLHSLGVDYIDESELLTPADSDSAHSSAETMWPSSGSACCSASESPSERRDQFMQLSNLPRLVGSVANNINQIARHANATGEVPAEAAASIAHARAVIIRIDRLLADMAGR
jgi:hypothetical protein